MPNRDTVFKDGTNKGRVNSGRQLAARGKLNGVTFDEIQNFLGKVVMVLKLEIG